MSDIFHLLTYYMLLVIKRSSQIETTFNSILYEIHNQKKKNFA